MKFWKRFFSLFSCLVLLFAVFSIPAAAAGDLTKKVHVSMYATTAGLTFGQIDVVEGETGVVEGQVYHYLQGNIGLESNHTIAYVDGSTLMESGSKYTVFLDNISFDALIHEDNGTLHEFSFGQSGLRQWIDINITYTDGSVVALEHIDNSDPRLVYNSEKHTHSFKLDIEPKKDILKVTFKEGMNPGVFTDFTSTHGTVDVFSGYEYPMRVSITKEDKTEGLLSGLLEWVKSIGEKVSDSFDVINSGFANIGTWFAELPSKIWSVMENGIKGLFVPDQQYMESYSNKWEQLLSDRLGAVYQVCDITLNSWDAIMHADETNTITFPLVTIPLPDNASFSFGGYEVKIVPDGFSALATAVKSAVGILCTYLFVNGLMKRYEEVMGVKE